MELNVWFRADAATWIGTGHVMRCLTLADALSEAGASCGFICREHAGHLGPLILGRGHKLRLLPGVDVLAESYSGIQSAPLHAHWLGVTVEQDAAQTLELLTDEGVDWLIVDHYALDYRWENVVTSVCQKVMVIDDLADRLHNCDVLLDQTFSRLENDYLDIVSTRCQLLCGSSYAMLRPEFSRQRQDSLSRRRKGNFAVQRILITMGGVDAGNVTGDILNALSRTAILDTLYVTVVMGGTAPWLNNIRAQVPLLPFPVDIRVDVDNMAEVMSQADIAIGAAGATTWERCCLGLPSIMIVLAENQRMAGTELLRVGAAEVLAAPENIADELPALLEKLVTGGAGALDEMSAKAAVIVDGQGVQRVIDVIRRCS
tara:strand:- start:33353 stop:34471 length:1119 start_codon:yes stop_codon:yes gene_type:complete